MKKNIFDRLKESQQQQGSMPMLNLNTINQKSLPQVTQGLNNIVRTKDQLQKQQQALLQQQSQQQKPIPGVNLNGTKIQEDGDGTGSVDGTGDSHGFEPKTIPAKGIPSMGAPSQPLGMSDMAADSIPILEDEPTETLEIENHINDLLVDMFGFKYYFGKDHEQSQVFQKKDIQGSLFSNGNKSPQSVPYFDNIPNVRKEQLLSDRMFAQIIKLLDFDKFNDALNLLIRYKERKLQENFVKSEMFSIIAESETPKISKGELISYIKTKQLC